MKFLLLFFISLSALYSADVSLVVDLTTSKLSSIEKRMINGLRHTSQHYAAQGKSTDIVVIIHGGAYKFFIKTLSNSPYKDDEKLKQEQASLKQKLDALIKTQPVRFEICSQGMKRKHIEEETLYDFVHPIPSAMTGLIDWQKKGYAYIPIN